MNLEICSAQLKNGESAAIKFSRNIKSFVIGFSGFMLEYSGDDHHVKEVGIDLSNASIQGNILTVTPTLTLRDDSGHRADGNSYVWITAAALPRTDPSGAIPPENPDSSLFLLNSPPLNTENALPFPFASSIGTPMYKNHAAFGGDHHVKAYESCVDWCNNGHSITISASASISDKHRTENGDARGGLMAFEGGNGNFLCASFYVGAANQKVCLGRTPPSYKSGAGQWRIGAFVTKYSLSFGRSVDHHVRRMTVLISGADGGALVPAAEGDSVYVNINAVARIEDSHSSHKKDIPDNSLSGFIAALYVPE